MTSQDLNDRHPSPQGEPSAENYGTASGEDDLARQTSAQAPQAEDHIDNILNEVMRTAVALIPGVDEGSISVVTARDVTSLSGPT